MAPTIDIISRAYGVSSRTCHNWMNRAGIDLNDFLDPSLVAEKLAATAINRSPRLEKLKDKKTQLHICFRLGIAGITQPEQIL